ncbi:MAG: hypothetical protein H7X70_03170, partial [Candidatus Kapabacteria bacterium]|nr:hypothetical protein [Candidatus Kapabacteria bacterium]
MQEDEKVIVWIHSEVKTPPFSVKARRKAGLLLRILQNGGLRIDKEAVLIVDVFKKKSEALPTTTIQSCIARIRW